MRSHGIDISKYQVSFSPPMIPPNPIDFCIQRTGYGLRQDERYEELWDGVKQIPIRGAYHYFSSAVGWEHQANFFMETQAKHDYHFLALDIEVYYNKKSEGFWWGAKRFIDKVAKDTGKKVLVYTNPNVYKTWLLPYGDWMKDYPLWIAQYWLAYSPEKNPGMYRMKRTDWKFYQYTDKAKGASYGVRSGGIDLNVFNGTAEQLLDWVGISDNTSDKPPITDSEIRNEILNEAMQAIEEIKD